MAFISILAALYFFLPAYFANMTPTFATYFAKSLGFLAFLGRPIDFGKKIKGKPIFGSHKTWRGIILGTSVGILLTWLQKFLWRFSFFEKISFFNYQEINIFFLGFLISFGALFGDLICSLFKRRKNIKPGRRWIPFDQISFVFGSFLFSFPFFPIPILNWLIILVLTIPIHIFGNKIGFWLKISDQEI